jgi:peroxiredoxin
MAWLPQLEALHKKWHNAGLEVVGISFDDDAAQARKTIQKLKLSFPQVLVPADEGVYQLWQQVSGVGSLPHLFLVDPDGILRVDGSVNDVEKTVADLLKKKAEGG